MLCLLRVLLQSTLFRLYPALAELYEVHDVHSGASALSIQVGEFLYKGFLDGLVVPKGSLSFLTQIRLAIELKQSQADKAKYKGEHLG